MRTQTLIKTLLISAIVAAIPATAVLAGSPLMCHQIQIGDAKSLPWGKDTFDKSSKYDANRVVEDTLQLLDEELPVLARMETIRRAVNYIDRDIAKADRLFGSLMSRTLDAEVVMDPKVLALRYYDAGYFAATLQHAGIETSFGPVNGKFDLHRVPGYAWMVRGYKMTELDGDMALGLALATADTRLSEHNMFLERAVKTTKADDAARNDLLGWIVGIRGTTLEAVRAKYASADAGTER